MRKRDCVGLAEIVRRNLEAAKSADAHRAAGDVHQSLMVQIAYDLGRFCAARNTRVSESEFLVSAGLAVDNTGRVQHNRPGSPLPIQGGSL